MDSDWPTLADGLVCRRCGQVNLPASAAGRFACGNCGRILDAPATPGRRRLARWLARVRVLALLAGGLALLAWLVPSRGRHTHKDPGSDQSAEAGRPQQPWGGPPEGRMARPVGPGGPSTGPGVPSTGPGVPGTGPGMPGTGPGMPGTGSAMPGMGAGYMQPGGPGASPGGMPGRVGGMPGMGQAKGGMPGMGTGHTQPGDAGGGVAGGRPGGMPGMMGGGPGGGIGGGMMGGGMAAPGPVDPARRREAVMGTLTSLDADIAAYESFPETFGRCFALGDKYLLYAQVVANASPRSPNASRLAPTATKMQRLWARIKEDRFIASYPDSRRRLDYARAAFARALLIAPSAEQIGRAHQRLAVVECILGSYRAASYHAGRAAALAGDDGRLQRVRDLCRVAQKGTARR